MSPTAPLVLHRLTVVHCYGEIRHIAYFDDIHVAKTCARILTTFYDTFNSYMPRVMLTAVLWTANEHPCGLECFANDGTHVEDYENLKHLAMLTREFVAGNTEENVITNLFCEKLKRNWFASTFTSNGLVKARTLTFTHHYYDLPHVLTHRRSLTEERVGFDAIKKVLQQEYSKLGLGEPTDDDVMRMNAHVQQTTVVPPVPPPAPALRSHGE